MNKLHLHLDTTGLLHVHSNMDTQEALNSVVSLPYENCALLGYYAASSFNFLPTFRDDRSRNINKKLTLLPA
jgi:hypothetical protein